jgi:hypothetical protein
LSRRITRTEPPISVAFNVLCVIRATCAENPSLCPNTSEIRVRNTKIIIEQDDENDEIKSA